MKPAIKIIGDKIFTLIELLVVISIISVLLTMLLPALKKARSRSVQSVCSSNLKQFGLTFQMYQNDFDGWNLPWRLDGNFWYDTLEDVGYVSDPLKQLVCPGSENLPFGDASWALVPQSYCVNCSLVTNAPMTGQSCTLMGDGDNQTGYPLSKDANVERPSSTLVCLDGYSRTANVNNEFHVGTEGDTSNRVWPRHSGSCNILFVDGHVDGMKGIDITDDLLKLEK